MLLGYQQFMTEELNYTMMAVQAMKIQALVRIATSPEYASKVEADTVNKLVSFIQESAFVPDGVNEILKKIQSKYLQDK